MEQLRDLRIVLIGGRQLSGIEASGKSSVGNIIMGRDVFPTNRRTGCCQRAEGETQSRNITLVDTPAWWWHYSVENTPLFDRFEIIQSLSLCLPGPHAFLLVIPIDSLFPRLYRTALEEHLIFFGKEIWKHMIVVFTTVTSFDVSNFEKHLKNWPDLKWLLNKCQNRYSILDIRNQGDRSQVNVLLNTIDKMVEEINGRHFEANDKFAVQLHERRKRAKKKAEDRTLAIQMQRNALKALMLDGSDLPDLRLVIVGAFWAARSSAANAILGTNAFKVDDARTTIECTVRQAEINGRDLTVVDTPGWYYNRLLEKSSAMDKLEIQRSVALCPPGPHAFLLTVPIATGFNKAYQKAVEEHMGLFGEDVWKYTIILFTRGDWLGDSSIEERIETEEPHLQWLMSKCENRYQVFTCKDFTDPIQTNELIQKIDEMVTKNRAGHYESENGMLNEKLSLIQGRAKSNRMKVKRQRLMLQEMLKDKNQSLSELRIVLLGRDGSGKSSSGNTILFSNVFRVTTSEEFKQQTPTNNYAIHQRKIAECQVSVVDTPAWSASLDKMKHILDSVSVCSPGPHVFLLVISACQAFTQKDREDLETTFGDPFGERIWRHTMLLFSHGDWLRDKPIEEYIESEGEALKWVVKKCDNRYHVLNNQDWGDGSQVKHLLVKIKQMVVQNREEHYTPQEKKASTFQRFFGAKTLTEAEWNQREDELIQRVMQVLWMDLKDDDDSVPLRKRLGSLDIAYIPSMSGDSMSDADSLFQGDVSMSVKKVLDWKRKQRNYAHSSGYDSESIASSIEEV